MSAKRRTGFVTVDVSVDIGGVLDEISDDDLRDEYNDRFGKPVGSYVPTELADAIERRHYDEHRGPLLCCIDPVCDAATRVEVAA